MNIKKEKTLLIFCIIFFFFASIISIISANAEYLPKQIIWYLISTIIIIIIPKKTISNIINKYSFYIYILLIFSLIFLLFFGKEINGSKCWIQIPKVGSFQPSEFIKIILIILNAKIISKSGNLNLKLFFKICILNLIPVILIFLEPDTGMVIIILLTLFIVLFTSGFNKNIFIFLFLLFLVSICTFLFFYFNYQNIFIKLFGTSFFYRIDRLLDWSNKSGIQLENALASIKAAGLKGFGINNMPVYIPEAHTDFIFSIYASITGYIGTILLIIVIIIFDFILIKIAYKTKDKLFKYIIIGFISTIFYQQIQNIGMNIGLLPITGITLPFISYGGSSLLSYMIIIAIILKYQYKK